MESALHISRSDVIGVIVLEQSSLASVFVVIPIYEDLDCAKLLLQDFNKTKSEGLEVVLVDDGSPCSPLKVDDLRLTYPRLTVINLPSNLGHQKAILAGLEYVSTLKTRNPDWVAVMDGDGEDRLDGLIRLIQVARADPNKIVAAKRGSRTDSLGFKLGYICFKLLVKVLTGRWLDHGNFCIIPIRHLPSVLDQMSQVPHLASAVLVMEDKLSKITIDRASRFSGRSKMNFLKLVGHGLDALVPFTNEILTRVSAAALVLSTMSVLALLAALVLRVSFEVTPGWYSVTTGVLVVILIQSVTVSLLAVVARCLTNRPRPY